MNVNEEVSDFDRMISKLHETAELIKQHTESSYLARIPRVLGLDYPIFEGKVEDDPKEWINKCEDYFRQCGVSEAQKLGLATIHLRGEAGTWYLANQSKISNFKDLCDELCLNYEWTWVLNTNVLGKEKTVVQGSCSTKPNDDSFESFSNFVNVLKEEIKPLVQKIKPWGVSLRKAVKISR